MVLTTKYMQKQINESENDKNENKYFVFITQVLMVQLVTKYI